MEKKIVFFDIDGTLARNSKPASSDVCRAIRQLRKNGHYAVINTGRAKSYLYPEILEIGFDGVISAAGAHIEFNGIPVYDARVPTPLLLDTVNQIIARGITLILEGTNRIFALNPIAAIPHDIPILREPAALRDMAEAIAVNKYTYYLQSREQLAPLLPFLQTHYDLIIHHPDRYGEIILKGRTKATGMQRLLDFLGLPASASYAIGDSLNDLDILRAAGCGVAMGNAVEPLLAAADFVTGSIEEDGVALALKKTGLI